MNPAEPTIPDNGVVDASDGQAELVVEDLIEEVSIDGMCGVY